MAEVYFIIGPTACGKGAVGREIARRLGGRILSVDSMKVYRRMDIGTATPSPEVLAAIPHYGINIVDPAEHFSVSRYRDCAAAAVAETRSAGAVPLAVGGTSLYLKALYDGLFEGPPRDERLRDELDRRIETDGLESLHAELAAADPETAERVHPNDRKRIVRALEVYRLTGRPISRLQTQWERSRQRPDYRRIGLRREKEDLHRRINARVGRMIEAGLLDEVRSLRAAPGGLSKEAAQAVGYAEMIEYLRGSLTFDEAVERIKINTRQLAKKQRTWQRRWTDVTWFDVPADEAPADTADRIMAAVEFV